MELLPTPVYISMFIHVFFSVNTSCYFWDLVLLFRSIYQDSLQIAETISILKEKEKTFNQKVY